MAALLGAYTASPLISDFIVVASRPNGSSLAHFPGKKTLTNLVVHSALALRSARITQLLQSTLIQPARLGIKQKDNARIHQESQ
jgi:hypothetical protein